MIIKGIVEEDFSNYKKPSMLIATARCSMKCDELNGCQVCQNSPLLFKPDIEISNEEIISKYLDNVLMQALIFGGMEPLDTFVSVISLIKDFREVSDDPIIIYTGYTEEEIHSMGVWDMLKPFGIIIKVGRYIMNCEPHYDELLGVELASPNQYAVRIE